MYSDTAIIANLYNNIELFIVYSAFIALLMLLITKKFNLGLIDPLNFYWIFTFSTSYAVVIILYENKMISDYSFFIVLYYFIILSLSIYLSYRLKNIKLRNFRKFESSSTAILKISIFLYFSICLIYLSKIDLNTFFLSRFEANKGVGFIARILGVLRLIVIGYYFSYILNKKESNNHKWILFLFILFSSLVTGAKASIIEAIYIIAIIYVLNKKIKIKFLAINYRVIFTLLIICSFALYFTHNLAIQKNYLSQYTNLPPAIELLISRIFANGDMYYLGLTNNILLDKIQTQFSSLQLLLRPYLGESLTQYIWGKETITIGRAIWLYWYPNAISGGSTDHYDLAAYSYFGWIGGTLVTIMIGIFIGLMNKVKMSIIKSKSTTNINSHVFFSIMYLKSYVLLLSPIVGITAIIDFITIYLLLNLILLLLTYAIKNENDNIKVNN